jgi:hypothetical protein
MTKANSLYLSTSRYVHGGETESKDGRIEWWNKKDFLFDPSDATYVVESVYEGNPQAIATTFYGDPRLWWFICQYNSILDPVGEITTGRILFIPQKDRMNLMLTGRTGGFESTRELVPTIPPVVV